MPWSLVLSPSCKNTGFLPTFRVLSLNLAKKVPTSIDRETCRCLLCSST